MGDELFCAIEERAQFGQINNIRAGCAQMMNHPMVLPRDGNNREWEKKTNIDQDASRGAPLPGRYTIFVMYMDNRTSEYKS